MSRQAADPALYLEACEVIDFDHDAVRSRAKALAARTAEETARRCYQFVRDQVQHTGDQRGGPITCRASEVLAHRTGYCYAKSHLLAALLRANQIPCGLCYQRLSVNGSGEPFCLHGLNAIFLAEVGWYRVDPRGNREGIAAEFTPPTERLAFSPCMPDEKDLPEIRVDPLPKVVAALRENATWQQLENNLPDVTP